MDKLHSKIAEWKKKLASIGSIELFENVHKSDNYIFEKTMHGWRLNYSSPATALFALHQFYLLKKTKQQARSRWRVLMSDEVSEAFLEQAVLLGFNAIVLKSTQAPLALLARNWGLKVILQASWPKVQPLVTPFDPSYGSTLEKILAEYKNLLFFDALLWESPFFPLDMREELNRHAKLKIELFLAELGALESFTPLIYALTDSRYLNEMKSYAGSETFLLVTAQDENYWHMHDSPVLPWIKGNEKELPLMLHERVRRFLLPALSGAFVKVSGPLHAGTYAQANLYCCSQALWEGAFPENSFDVWARTYRPELTLPHNQTLLHQMQTYLPKIKYLEAIQRGEGFTTLEELKMHVEAWMVEWKLFEKSIDKFRKTEQLHPQQKRFILDLEGFFLYGKELARQAFQRHQITLPHMLSLD